MSKRHQAHRRKAYGRRQHEVRERHDRVRLPQHVEFSHDESADLGAADPFAFLDPRSARLHFAVGD